MLILWLLTDRDKRSGPCLLCSKAGSFGTKGSGSLILDVRRPAAPEGSGGQSSDERILLVAVDVYDLDVLLEVRINRLINGLFHLLVNGVYWGYNPLILTIY